MINKKDLVKKSGLMALTMKEIIHKAKKRAKESSPSQMEATMMVYSQIMRSVASGFIAGLMAKHTKDLGSRTKWMVKVPSDGKMENRTQVILSMINAKAMASSCGPMAVST